MGFTNMKGLWVFPKQGSASMVSARVCWGPVLCGGESSAGVSWASHSLLGEGTEPHQCCSHLLLSGAPRPWPCGPQAELTFLVHVNMLVLLKCFVDATIIQRSN